MADLDTDLETLKHKLLGETAQCSFDSLQRFFAQGVLLHVADGLDLIEVGVAVARDDAEQVRSWMQEGQVVALSDEVARQWLESDAQVWTSIVKPWILVQGRR